MKKFCVKKVYLFFSSLFIFLFHLPFVFGKTKHLGLPLANPFAAFSVQSGNNAKLKPVEPSMASMLYDSLKLGTMGLARQAFDYALKGLQTLRELGKVENEGIISIVDFSKPSSVKRLFVIDLEEPRVLFNTYVAHGVNSGTTFAQQFSNQPESYKSSLGFYETGGTYNGKNGYSMHLVGVEKGINDKAFERDIVMHGADYVDEHLISAQGYIGRSWGCPAVPMKENKRIIDRIKNGTCLFIYSPDQRYIKQSKILNRA